MRKNQEYKERSYRLLRGSGELIPFQVQVKETDLYIRAEKELIEEAKEAIIYYRFQLEKYILDHPEFYYSLTPLLIDEVAPPLMQEMMQAAQAVGVGPMAAVAGAIAEFVGRRLLAHSSEIIVENGGDIFLQTRRELQIGIFAGPSPWSRRLGIRTPPAPQGLGICTSSASVGPSISLGKADAVCVLASSAALADAAATALGNIIHSTSDIPRGLEKAQSIPQLQGVVIIKGDKLGAWGAVELLNL